MQIFSFWDQGRDQAPKIVQDCLGRWEELNPGCTLTVFQDSDLPGLLNDLPFDISLLPVQARADILRIRLLRQHGGIWADATVLPVLPLNMWHDAYVGPAGFFVYCASADHWRFTNFLILAQPGNHFIAALDDRIRQYWTHPRGIVDETPYRLHDHCHMLQASRNSLGEDFLRAVPMALLSAPIQKLDWRREWPDDILSLPDPARVLI